MLQRFAPIGLVLVLWGCGSSPVSKPGDAENAAPAGRDLAFNGAAEPASSGAVEVAVEKLYEADSSNEYRTALDALEKALQEDPANVDGLTAFWENMREVKTADGKDDYSLYRRAADLVRRALQSDKSLSDRSDFRRMAVDVFYNDACAKGAAQTAAECIAALREAVLFGWDDLDHLSQDSDLAAVRDTADFKTFFSEAQKTIETARQARKQAMLAEVVVEMADTTPFDFRFDVEDVTGMRISKAGYSGKVLIVDVWGTWCGPCLMELPHFIALHRKFHDQGLEIVGLNTEGDDADAEENTSRVREFIAQRKLPYSCALLTKELSEMIPDLTSVPTTLFFDRTGKLRLRAVGYHDLLKLEVIVEQLLNEKAE